MTSAIPMVKWYVEEIATISLVVDDASTREEEW